MQWWRGSGRLDANHLDTDRDQDARRNKRTGVPLIHLARIPNELTLLCIAQEERSGARGHQGSGASSHCSPGHVGIGVTLGLTSEKSCAFAPPANYVSVAVRHRLSSPPMLCEVSNVTVACGRSMRMRK